MKRVVVAVLSAAVLCSSPAKAQVERTYSCSGPTETFRVMIGPHEMRRFVDGSWGNNWCALDTSDLAHSSCTFEGTRFVASVEGETVFTLDSASGAFFDSADPFDDSSSDEQGSCRAE